MKGQFLNIGYGSYVDADKIVGIIKPDAAPIKRLIQNAKENLTLIDATAGRRTRAVLIMSDGHLIVSGLQVETLVNRLDEKIKIPTIKVIE